MITAYIGLGSNVGDRHALIAAALAALADRRILRQLRASPLYETDAVTPEPQPPYLNAVARGQTDLTAAELLSACLRIEADLGRVRPPGQRHAARTLDLDVLLYGAEVIDSPTLRVPHPALLARPFVLIPLADVAQPDLVHPGTGVSLAQARQAPSVRPLVRRTDEG